MAPKKHKSGHQKELKRRPGVEAAEQGPRTSRAFFLRMVRVKLPRAAETLPTCLHSFNVCNISLPLKGRRLEPTLAVIWPRYTLDKSSVH